MDVIMISLFVALLWGITPIIHKHVLKNTDPKVVVITGGVIYFVCVMIFGLYFYEDIKDGISKMTWTTFAWIASASIFTAFLANILYIFTMKKYKSHVVTALTYSSPFFTLILAYFILKEKVTWKSFLGVVFIVCGVLLIAYNQNVEEVVDLH